MKQLPFVYNQRDSQWSSQRLGTVDGTTIGGYGCFVTCFAMTAGYFGHEIKPNALDDIFTSKSLYVQGNLCTDDMLSKVFPDIHYQQSFNYASSAADLGNLQRLSADPNTLVILEIDFDHNPNDGIQTHFVICVDCDGTNLKIADPWYGTVDDFSLHYGTDPKTTIQKFVVYQGTRAAQTVNVDSKTFENLVTKSTQYDNFVAAGYTSVDDINNKLAPINSEVNDYKTKYEDEQRHTIELNSQMADLSSALEKVKNESKDYGTQILDAQHQVDTLTANLQSLYTSLNATTQEEALQSVLTLREQPDQCVEQYNKLYSIVFNEANGYIQKIMKLLHI